MAYTMGEDLEAQNSGRSGMQLIGLICTSMCLCKLSPSTSKQGSTTFKLVQHVPASSPSAARQMFLQAGGHEAHHHGLEHPQLTLPSSQDHH